jgi:phosphoribosylformylglycinamidine synthase I
MQLNEIRACILRVGGTNCDAETQRALEDIGVKADIVHLNSLVTGKNLLDYAALILPGGFSYGDYVRAGAILAKGIVAKLGKQLKQFVKEERPILGICNGFQVLVESGLLPGFNRISRDLPQAALATNIPIGYRCMWIHLRHESKGKCIFTKIIGKGKVIAVPVAHGEGRFIFEREKEREYLQRLYDEDQLVFRYCTEAGSSAEGRFPINPNGAFHDIAGVCDSTGTIFGLMPHPERAYFGWQLPDWTKSSKFLKYGDGKEIFLSMANYLIRRF